MSEYLQLHFHLVFVKEALEPGYPRDSTDKALVGNIYYQLRLGRDREVGSEAMEELLFVLRPFVFACHKVGRSIPLGRVFPLVDLTRRFNHRCSTLHTLLPGSSARCR
jgi:hypothetical protein